MFKKSDEGIVQVAKYPGKAVTAFMPEMQRGGTVPGAQRREREKGT